MSKKIKSFISIFALTAMVFILLFTSENATFTVNAAKDNVVIVLDPGHGGTGDRNLGAQYNGISEKEITLKVANYAKAYLEKGHKIKATVRFKGRQLSHPELGSDVLMRFAAKLEDVAEIESMPKMEGRNMQLFLTPKK